jgi:hypothetical protein
VSLLGLSFLPLSFFCFFGGFFGGRGSGERDWEECWGWVGLVGGGGWSVGWWFRGFGDRVEWRSGGPARVTDRGMTSECGCAGALGYDDDGVTSWKRSAIGGFTRLDGGSMVVGVQQRVVPRWYRMEFRGFSTVLRSRYFSFRDDRRLGSG